ncbi:cytochrome b [Rhizobacter fulvus]
MPSLSYDRRSIFFHWLTAGLVVALWLAGQTIDWFPKGDARVAARSLHIVFGALLALVIALRIFWRLSPGAAHPPPAGAGALDTAAGLAHRLLYLLLVVTVALGVANAWVRGDSVFALFKIPAFDPGNRNLREMVEDWHGLAANMLLGLALFHAAAALVHQFVLKDDLLRRMWPRR